MIFITKKIPSICLSPFLFLALILSSVDVSAGEQDQYIIISGQVLNKEYGNPIEGHSVYVSSDLNSIERASIHFEFNTNEEGYYYDTIFTISNNGSLKVFTYDYLDKEVDTTVHFRFMNVFSNTLIANFDIYMPYQLQKLQARFSHYQLTPGDRFSHQFIDQTDNDFIISWQWDFGDGNTSSMQNPSHTYTEPGLYKIILNMRSEQLGVVESSVTTQQIYISELAYYHMGGHAFAHKFPIDDGLAYLYLADSSKRTLVPIDTCEFDTLGYYYFYQLPQGEYIVKSQPQNSSIYYADMLPTYYGDKIFWQNAKTIQHNETKWEYDIQLTEGEGLSVGMGSISGRVVYQGVNRNGDSIPAQGVDIFLFNTLNENLVSHYSNEEGLFDFSGIQTGDYWVYPEVTGQQSNMLKVTVSESTLNVSDIQITILPTDINLDIPEPIVVSDMSLQKLYPNPARDQINLDFKAAHKQQLNLKIYDMMGRLIQSELVQAQAGSNTVSIGTDKMGNGIYTLGLMINGALSEQRFVVKH